MRADASSKIAVPKLENLRACKHDSLVEVPLFSISFFFTPAGTLGRERGAVEQGNATRGARQRG